MPRTPNASRSSDVAAYVAKRLECGAFRLFPDWIDVAAEEKRGDAAHSKRFAQFGRGCLCREAFGVRRIPPLCACLSSGICQFARMEPKHPASGGDPLPAPPRTLALPPGPSIGLLTKPPPKDWPHAPVHRLSENAVYIVTAGTLHKQHLFNTDAKRDLLERMLLSMSKRDGWQLEAWAVMADHYHFVARGNQQSTNLQEFLQQFHYDTACALNGMEEQAGRKVWYNFRDTRLTHQYSYLARLNYVHQNPVKHGLVRVANQYPWCSAAWFERTASPAQVKTIYSFKTDKVNVEDDF